MDVLPVIWTANASAPKRHMLVLFEHSGLCRTLGDVLAQTQVEKKPVGFAVRLTVVYSPDLHMLQTSTYWWLSTFRKLSDGIIVQEVNKRRVLATAAYATAVVGPIGHGWYSGLDVLARRYFLPGSLGFVAAKVRVETRQHELQ
jgi:hypothetical protein